MSPELLSFLKWTVTSVPTLVPVVRDVLRNWGKSEGHDVTEYMRAIEVDTHSQVDADIDANLAAAYAADGKTTKG